MNKKKLINIQIVFLILIVISTFLMCIGYASINTVSMRVSGTASVVDGDVRITNVQRIQISNVTENQSARPNANGNGIIFNISATVTRNNFTSAFFVKYKVTMTNNSFYDQAVLASNLTPTFESGNIDNLTVAYEIEDENGNPANSSTIPAKSSKDFYLTINLYPIDTGSWTISGETELDTAQSDEGVLRGSVSNDATGNLRNPNTRAQFTATVLNSYQVEKSFSFSINNSSFILTDENGSPLYNMVIDANTTEDFTFYIQKVNGARFPNDEQKLNIYLNNVDDKSSMGIVTLLVDKDIELTDNEAPMISNVKSEIKLEDDNSVVPGKIYVSWEGSDNVGVSYYTVETYKANSESDVGSKIKTNNTSADETNMFITGLDDNYYYYFKVYGIDGNDNTATSSEISSCSTSEGHCSRSASTPYKWHFTVTLRLTNAISSQGSTTTNGNVRTVTFSNVLYNSSVQTTLSAANTSDYNRPSTISSATITYPDNSSETLPANTTNRSSYSYTASSGLLNIWSINGDINMQASARSRTCLLKGTKVLLANGKEKNIEDINYDDLLAVWNYDTGELTYEYPLWIENEGNTDNYMKITFSDNSTINVVGDHAFYNTDLNLFVNTQDKDNFKIGSNIAKVNNDGTFDIVSVKNIETINEDNTYYFVGTTTYYNIIANNFLTTDHNTIISNLYGFNNNATWPSIKKEIVNNKNNIIEYDLFKDVLPYYMYKGFRAGESGYLINKGIFSLNEFKYYITNKVTNKESLKIPIQKNSQNYWMVTTSEDIVTSNNKNNYLNKEGSLYTLPNNNKKNFIAWLNTSDNKFYFPNDIIIVSHGLHFIALYK